MVSVGVSTLTNFEIVLCLHIMHFSALQGREIRKSGWNLLRQVQTWILLGKAWELLLEQIITRWGQGTSRAPPLSLQTSPQAQAQGWRCAPGTPRRCPEPPILVCGASFQICLF